MPVKPNRTIHFIVLMLILTTFCAAAGAGIAVKRVASALDRPLYVTAPPGDTGRLFIVEQHTGRIKILNLNAGLTNATPFLDIDGLATGNEQGLLGLAFDPNYAANGFFYVNLTQTNGTTNIRRYQVSASDPDVADPATGTTVMTCVCIMSRWRRRKPVRWCGNTRQGEGSAAVRPDAFLTQRKP
jgi:hypothetical protein